MGEVVYDLSLAYIASWIFYVVVVTIPKSRNDKNINVHISRIVDRIIQEGSSVLHGLSSSTANRQIEMPENEFKALCHRIGPDSVQDLFMTVTEKRPITYLQHINSVREIVTKQTQILFIYISHLDPELIRLVNDIVYCQLISDLDYYFLYKKYRFETFENISDPLYVFYSKIHQLKKYQQRNM